MRLIDIGPILAWANDPEVHEPYGVRGSELVRKLWDAPIIETIDAVSVVRCADCVYCNVQNTKYLYAICQKHCIEFKPFEDDTRTHGCTWGERKGE